MKNKVDKQKKKLFLTQRNRNTFIFNNSRLTFLSSFVFIADTYNKMFKLIFLTESFAEMLSASYKARS